MHLNALKEYDEEIYNAVQAEKERQMNGIELIPSENLVSQAVLEAMGSVPTNKYSEGYPHKRYYAGNEVIDTIEDIAIGRAKELFGAEHVNVQSLSGSPANMAMYMALIETGDKFMGMDLSMGGHLTHGSPVNFSGQLYKPVPYGVNKETEMLDYDAIKKMAQEEKPKLLLSGFTAYPREIDFKAFREICDDLGIYCCADIAHIAGLCAGGAHENPVPYFDVVTTTTHKTLRGPRGAMIMCKEEHAKAIDKAVFPGLQGGPHDHITAAKAVSFKEALEPSFKEYAKQIVKNSKALADTLISEGLRLVSGGTDNHLMLVDVRNKGINGKIAAIALAKAEIYCNKNTIPYDPGTPWEPSGIRIGTPVLATRGMKETHMDEVGKFISRVLSDPENDSALEKVSGEVKEFCKQFPFYK